MSNYLIELSVIHVALIVGYWFFLRKERQYTKMRFYLLSTTLLALIIPLVKLPKLFFNSKEAIDVIIIEALPLDVMTIAPAAEMSTWKYDLFIWTYIFISTGFLFQFFSSVLYLIYLKRKSSYEQFNDLKIRRVGNIKGSFTFFNWIFLSDEIDKNQPDYAVILKHEEAHASMGHTYDLLFFGLFKAFFWWLPTAWFINKEIKKIHEYQADAYALKSYNLELYSSILISSTLKTNGLSLASSFHDGLILKRLKEMKQQAKNVSPWKLGALTTLCAMLFVLFACSEEKMDGDNFEGLPDKSEIEREIFTLVEDQPEYEGGMDAFYQYVASEMRYPLEARQQGIEGQVDVQFLVEKDGSLTGVKAIKGIGAGCDDEAVRVVQNTSAFKPGSQRGRKLRVRMQVPITFKLNKGKTNPDNSTQGSIIVGELESKNGKLKVNANYNNGEWSGTVHSPENEKLPGVNIVVAGTLYGTVTDLDGTFKVKANQSQELHISFVGYETVKIMAE